MIRILQLEDCDADAVLIGDVLRRASISCEITRVETREAFLDSLDRPDWDIILADYSLPSFDGMSALRLAVEKWPEIPFVFVTGYLGEARAVETFAEGATDFILKDRLERLPQAIQRAVRERRLASARKEAEQKLKASLCEKIILLQEVHHRVNNNLQIIVSLLNIQAGTTEDPELASVLRVIHDRIASMAMIQSLFHNSGEIKEIDVAEYIRLLAEEISRAYNVDSRRVGVTLDLEPVAMTIDQAIPCGLIINELLTNAFRYAFPDDRPGRVCISMCRREGSVRMTVEDNGVGMHAHASDRRIRNGGLNIIDALVMQLGGSMVASSDSGTSYALQFASRTSDSAEQIPDGLGAQGHAASRPAA